MFLKEFAEVAPKPLLAGLLAYGALHYFIAGPEIAARVARVDYIPVCEQGFKDVVAKAGEQRLRDLKLPQIDAAQEFALDQARNFLNSPAIGQLRAMGGDTNALVAENFGLDFDGATRFAIGQYEESKRAAREAYDRSLAVIEDETATSLAKSGEVCGCVADLAIGETRAEWAVFSGTLGLVRMAPLKTFDEKMAQINGQGRCLLAGAGAQ